MTAKQKMCEQWAWVDGTAKNERKRKRKVRGNWSYKLNSRKAENQK